LSRDREWNVQPGTGGPGAGSVQNPEGAREHGERSPSDHQKQLALQMGVAVSEHKEEFVRQESRPSQNEQTEARHGSEDSEVEPAQTLSFLAAGKGGSKDVHNQVC